MLPKKVLASLSVVTTVALTLGAAVSVQAVDTAPTRTIDGASTKIDSPYGLSMNASGMLFSANSGDSATFKAITAYPKTAEGDVAPTRDITDSGASGNNPRGVDIANDQTIYAVYNQGVVRQFAADANGASTPLREFSTPTGSVRGITVDAAGYVYVSGNNADKVWVYAPGGSSPTRILNVTSPTGLRIDLDGKLLVSSNNELLRFEPAGSSDNSPVSKILIADSGNFGANGIDIDSAGRIYISGRLANQIAIYAPSAFADPSTTTVATPLATISGGNTQMQVPTGVVVDRSLIYVSNQQGGSLSRGDIQAYANPLGNVGPRPGSDPDPDPGPSPSPTPQPTPSKATATPVGNCVIKPRSLPSAGTRKIMKRSCVATSGKAIKVSVRGKASRGDLRLFRVIRTKQGTFIRTYGRPAILKITWKASATADYKAYKSSANYRVG